MKNQFTYLLILTFIGVISSCSRDLSPIAYVQYVENSVNGLKQETIIEGTKVTLQYKPLDYIIVQNLKQEQINQVQYNQAKSEQGKGYIYFNLRLSINEGQGWSDPSKEDTFHSILAGEFKEQIHLKLDDQKIPASIYYLETGMGVFPHSTVLLGFEVQEGYNENMTLQIQKNKLIPYPVTLTIQQEDIKNTPVLKLI